MTWQLHGLDDGTFAQKLLNENTTWLTDLKDCPQDPIHHAEGDVLTHVLMVCQELVRLKDFQASDSQTQQILAWAALLHDVAKPASTVHQPDGRISSPGHASRGAVRARRILWERDCPFHLREIICNLVYYHMRVFWALEQDDPARLVREISLHCPCHLLSILATADARGRHCPDQQDLLDKVELFREVAREAQCLHEPYPFASDTGRFQYLQGKWHNPELAPYEDFRCRVILLSGLPGAGKDTWIQNHGQNLPVVSLDNIRRQLSIDPRSNQARVADLAREKAREYLRAKQDFIWNATNLSKMIRAKSLSLFLDYNAHVTIVYLDKSVKTVEQQNRERENSVTWEAIEKMMNRWEVPSPREAHSVLFPQFSPTDRYQRHRE